MRKMTQAEWCSMTQGEQYYFLNGSPMIVETASGIPASSKVGDGDQGVKRYRALCRDTIVSNWCDSELEARTEGLDFIKMLDPHNGKQFDPD